MQNKRYIIILLILSAPLLAVFTQQFLGYTLTMFWGFLGWMMAVSYWIEDKEKTTPEPKQEKEEPKLEEVAEAPEEEKQIVNPFVGKSR